MKLQFVGELKIKYRYFEKRWLYRIPARDSIWLYRIPARDSIHTVNTDMYIEYQGRWVRCNASRDLEYGRELTYEEALAIAKSYRAGNTI